VRAVNLVRQVGEPRDVLAKPLRLNPRLENRLALLFGQDHRDLFDLLEHVMSGLVQDLRPLVVGELRPGDKRFCRRLRCFVDVRRTTGRDYVYNFAGCRVGDLVGLA